MSKIILYSYLRCSTCRKASIWLDKKNFNYSLIDIVKEPPSRQFLALALKQFSNEKRKIFNTRGKNFKLIDFDILNASNDEIIQLLQADGKLIKRPFLVFGERKIILGFNENEYSNIFL